MISGSIDRRDFARRTSLSVSSILAAGVFFDRSSCGREFETSDERLLVLGLNGLARAHQFDYFADGHRGASMVAAHLLCADNELGDQTLTRITELFELNWAPTELCQDFAEADPDPASTEKIGLALAEGGEVLRQVGHNAIFAMLAIKALRLVPEVATPERIEGICTLIRSFTPWQDIEPDPEVDPPPFAEAQACSRFILREALAAIDRFIGFGQGFAGHMLTFGQALVELAAMGDEEWAESCRTAFRKYVTVTRRGPPPDAKRYADHKPSALRPIDLEYWHQRGDKSLGIGHVFKYPYSYYDLLHRANDPHLARDWEAKAYHVF